MQLATRRQKRSLSSSPSRFRRAIFGTDDRSLESCSILLSGVWNRDPSRSFCLANRSASCTTIFKSVQPPGHSLPQVEPRMSDVAAKIFEESLNKVVLVQLKGGRSVRGRLYSFDQHMNLVLEEAEDVTNADATKKLGTIIVRGDNVVLVSPPPKR